MKLIGVIGVTFSGALTKSELGVHLTMYDVKRLDMYCRNLVDYHLIVDLIPTLARLYFLQKMGDVHLSAAQAVSIIVERTILSLTFFSGRKLDLCICSYSLVCLVRSTPYSVSGF